jgi:hypothetical protein
MVTVSTGIDIMGRVGLGEPHWNGTPSPGGRLFLGA